MNVPTLKRFTIEEYHRLIKLGFFQEDDRIELIWGQLIHKIQKSTAHSACNTRLTRQLIDLLEDQATIQNQSPITLANNSEPEPDLAIVQNRPDDYLSGHPRPEDILLVIEISDLSLTYDQETKLEMYAEDNIQNYWIFNLLDRVLEMYSEPYRKSDSEFGYRLKRIALPNERVKLPQFSELDLDLSSLFPLQQNFDR
ncbi:MAG: Uma2 family endonuclease [Leptolyngbya sp. UWPOB_LEPTO1]|uniref:Uma2 family endonuclease n=1 Tax=Leptolyngbya sp. UWPOB_LEPTO1 TaxID=2815653 RepID=UPI001AC602C8|nr:Uma2 family endonuclease [Leptolyngbya sp. UWPOB_LEPTO1]MBN8560295.1 Uma2 family endonuclease [Leptolyngbya sp. UWPOB_LEPTO1]